jgi:protein subunit release factor A
MLIPKDPEDAKNVMVEIALERVGMRLVFLQ